MGNTLRFEWEDKPEIGHYKCSLFEGDTKIDEIAFRDYTCEFHQKQDEERGTHRLYAFEANRCSGWRMRRGFDPDPGYLDNKEPGYQGTATHTVADIKHWCENWLAGRYIEIYENMLKELQTAGNRAEWFKEHGYGKDKA